MTLRLRADWPAQVTEDHADHPVGIAVDHGPGEVWLCTADELANVLAILSPQKARRLARFLASAADEADRCTKREAS